MKEFELTKIDPRKIYKVQKETEELHKRLGLETSAEDEWQRTLLNRWIDNIEENEEGGFEKFWENMRKTKEEDLQKLEVALDRFLELMKNQAVLHELRPDGTWAPVKEHAASEPEFQ